MSVSFCSLFNSLNQFKAEFVIYLCNSINGDVTPILN